MSHHDNDENDDSDDNHDEAGNGDDHADEADNDDDDDDDGFYWDSSYSLRVALSDFHVCSCSALHVCSFCGKGSARCRVQRNGVESTLLEPRSNQQATNPSKLELVVKLSMSPLYKPKQRQTSPNL